jgi:hypothetical protein
MTNYSFGLGYLIRLMRHEAKTHTNPIERAKYQKLLDIALTIEGDIEDLVAAAQNIGVRNPAFDGDMVGWLDDDFDDDEDEVDKDE